MENILLQKKGRRGFTLVETLVAVTILLLVIIGPMTIAQRGMQSALYAGDQITAIYLAQEAIEHMQQLRDDNALEEYLDGVNGGNTSNWYTNLDSDCKDAQGCDINFEGGGYADCGNTGSCRLEINTSNAVRVYGYGGSGWTSSPYTRVIRVGAPVAGSGTVLGGVPITVTVSWTASILGGSTRSITLQTYLYDHYTRYE